MLEHPIGVINVHSPLLDLRLADRCLDSWCSLVVDRAGTVPRNVLILVVRLTFNEPIARVGDLALNGTLSTSLGGFVVINHAPASNNHARAKLPENRASRNDSYRATLVRMGDDLTLNHVSLLVIVNDDFMQFQVFRKEQITVPKTNATSRLGGKHV
jgi:hypothetical protein